MAIEDDGQKKKLNDALNDWLTRLLAGWAGKVLALIAIPLFSYFFGLMMSSAEKTRESIAQTNKRIDAVVQQLQIIQWRQGEMLRHMAMIERQVLGYTTLQTDRDEYIGPSYGPPAAPLIPPAPSREPEPMPGGDKKALLDPVDKRRGFVRLPLLVRSGHQRR